MKLDLLKKLIKEAVKEAVREELESILSEDIKPVKAPISTVTKYENYKPPVIRPVSTGDPIMDLLNETRHNMTSGEYQNIVGGNSAMVDGGDYSGYSQGPEPGIDLSQLDFIKNAGAIFKASVEKDKQRLGA
jgi:hypothetical protein